MHFLRRMIAPVLLTVLCMAPFKAGAQRIQIKTNALEYLALTPNLAVETRLNRTLSLQLALAANPIKHPICGYSLSHFRVEPELRYWFNRPMARHFIALSFSAAAYSLELKNRYIKGDAVGAGISYGYALVLSEHWNMEVEVGLGLASVSAYDYRGREIDKPETKNLRKIMPVPIRLGLSFGYIF